MTARMHAETQHLVRLVFLEIEETHRFAKSVALKSGRPKHGFVVGHGQGRRTPAQLASFGVVASDGFDQRNEPAANGGIGDAHEGAH